MPTKHKSHSKKFKGGSKKTKKMSTSMSHKTPMKMSHTGGITKENAWCVHEREKHTLINGKKVFFMTKGKKRARLIGTCNHCHKEISQFTSV